MPYNYLTYLSRNIVFIWGFTLIWAIVFFHFSGSSPVFIAYAVFSVLFSILGYLHWRGRERWTAILFIAVSDIILFLADEGLYTRPMTGIEFLYVINLLYALAFFLEGMRTWFSVTVLSTLVVFVSVNCTSISPKLLATVHSRIPDINGMLIFGLTASLFAIRFLIFLYTSTATYLENKLAQNDGEMFFANIEESICILDRDMHMKRFNRAFVELFSKHYDVSPTEGMNFKSIRFNSPRLKMYMDAIDRAFTGEQIKIEIEVPHGDTVLTYEVSLCPIVDKKGVINRIGLIYRDITARKRLEMDIVYTQNGLLEMIAHDLKAPLAMIKSINSLAGDGDNQYNRFIDKTCIQTIASIDNVLSFSRYLVTSDTLGYVNENIGQVLSEKVTDMDPNASINGQRLFLKITDHDLHVRMNRDAFGRAIGNLISNSIKFTEGNGEIQIRLMRDGENHALIKVSDQGIGIPEDMRANLFDRFTKSGRNGLRGEQSYGLGLYISNVIIKLHGGSLTLDTETSVGTTFVIRLPLAKAN